MVSREYTAQLTSFQRSQLVAWLTQNGSGVFRLGRVTFESVERGGLIIRTKPATPVKKALR